MFSVLIQAVPPADAAPWWGVPLIAGLFLLAGGVIGGLISFFSVRAADRRRAAREDEQRWDNELLIRAGRVLSTIDALYIANSDYQATINDLIRTRSDTGFAEANRAARAKAEAATSAFATARTELALIAPTDVVETATLIGVAFARVQAKLEVLPVPPVYPSDNSYSTFISRVRAATGVPDYSKRKAPL